MTHLIRLIALPFQQEIFSDLFYQISKRMIDIVFSVIILSVCLLFMPFAYAIVKTDTSGKFFYQQKRHGQNGREFTIYKIRTMYDNLCDDGEKQCVDKDPRITKTGKILRDFYIDELPQIYNVLKGDMSLVGPRPHAVPMDQYYAAYIPFYKDRHQVKPGITGLAQVKGFHGEVRLIQDMEQRVLFDLEYINTQSLWLDMIILLKTVGIVFNKIC